MGGRVILFSLLSGGGSQFLSRFFSGRVIIFLKVFIEKINYEYLAAAEACFRFLLILPLPSKRKCPGGRNKKFYMNLDVRYGFLKEGQTAGRILLFYC